MATTLDRIANLSERNIKELESKRNNILMLPVKLRTKSYEAEFVYILKRISSLLDIDPEKYSSRWLPAFYDNNHTYEHQNGA